METNKENQELVCMSNFGSFMGEEKRSDEEIFQTQSRLEIYTTITSGRQMAKCGGLSMSGN